MWRVYPAHRALGLILNVNRREKEIQFQFVNGTCDHRAEESQTERKSERTLQHTAVPYSAIRVLMSGWI